MAWQTPKTNWDTAPKNPKAEDLNRIEANLDFLKTDIETKKGLIVDSMVSNLNRSVTIANTHQELADALVEPTLLSANIKSGFSIFGVAGNPNVVDTSPGDAVAANILSGKKAFVDGSLVTGTIPSKGVAIITPGAIDQTIEAGQYLSGIQTIAGDADLVASSIKHGVDIFGVIGNVRDYNDYALFVPNKNRHLNFEPGWKTTTSGIFQDVSDTTELEWNTTYTACGSGHYATLVSVNPVDLTDMNYLRATMLRIARDSPIFIGISPTKTTGISTWTTASLTASAIKANPGSNIWNNLALNVSSFSGLYYIYVGLHDCAMEGYGAKCNLLMLE